jgi:hypothetical protein
MRTKGGRKGLKNRGNCRQGGDWNRIGELSCFVGWMCVRGGDCRQEKRGNDRVGRAQGHAGVWRSAQTGGLPVYVALGLLVRSDGLLVWVE